MVILGVKILVELIQQEFEKQRKAEVALADKKKIIKKALKQLLRAFDGIFEKHEELGDTDVRERMYDAIHKSFIKPRRGYVLPKEFGMFSDEGNKLVYAAIQKFLTHPEVVAASKSLRTPEDRLYAFQDFDVETSEGTNCFEYFGYQNKPNQD